MFKKTLLVAMAVIAFTATAHATTIDLTLGQNSGPGGYDWSKGGKLDPNIDLTNTSDLSLSNGSGILHKGTDINGVATSPRGHMFDKSYLFVTGGSKATFSLASNGNTFGFTWGTIDAYDTVLVTDSRGVTYRITGTEILNQLANPNPGQSQVYFSLNDPFGQIVQVVLEASGNSFEASNFYGSPRAVPLPASVMMFGFALAGLGFLSYRRKQGAAL